MLLLVLLQFESRVARPDASLLTLAVRLVVHLVGISVDAPRPVLIEARQRLAELVFVVLIAPYARLIAARTLQVRKSNAAFLLTTTAWNAAPRADNSRFVGQVLGQLADGLVLVEAILVHIGLARKHVFP